MLPSLSPAYAATMFRLPSYTGVTGPSPLGVAALPVRLSILLMTEPVCISNSSSTARSFTLA